MAKLDLESGVVLSFGSILNISKAPPMLEYSDV